MTKAGVLDTSRSPNCIINPAPVGAVKMKDGFWKRWMEANWKNGIPALLKQLEDHGIRENFRLVSGKSTSDTKGPVFRDSDFYKWMEAAAWTLAWADDADLKNTLDECIEEVAAAQQPDGYINTFFHGDLADQRFRNLPVEHELYCGGHLIQAAIAHHRATGETSFLDVACKFADYLVAVFGPGKKEEFDGHPEIEMALVELYRTTGKKDYLKLAGFFLKLQKNGTGGQIAGHAVRAGYLMSGVLDYYSETGDKKSFSAAADLWEDMATGRVYVTGGLGSRHYGEEIGDRYELPNLQAYAETCAAISNGMWSFRLLCATGEAKYADMMEKAFYNGFLAGVSLDTTHWFYVNPLACWGKYQRSPWFGCTCCPTNAVRTIASMPGYMYGTSKDGLWLHLYDNSTLDWELADGAKVRLEQTTMYPWDGKVKIKITLDEPKQFGLHLRIPGWCRKASVKINDNTSKGSKKPGYLILDKKWKSGDVIILDLKMPVELVECDRRVRENIGSVAITRGPIVYCLESPDNPDYEIRDVEIAGLPKLEPRYSENLLGGIVILEGRGTYPVNDDRGPLYRFVDYQCKLKTKKIRFKAIPYYAWANRGPSHMTIWIPWAAFPAWRR